MSQNAIEVRDLSKVYNIGHEHRGMKGTATFRDALAGFAKKPVELITGHRLKKEEFWALKDINFTVQRGDVVGIIGKNGSGKSTLLKILSQIVDPTEGEIRMHGKVASLLEVGTGFHPELTGRENIFFNGAILGMKRKEIISKFDEIVAFSEVEQFLDTPVKFYSSGMYVRLAFSVAAHLDPDILIVDEVLAVGDAAFQKKSLGKMKSVAASGRTVLFVSHSMHSVSSLCNKAILLNDGAIIASGPTDNMLKKYNELLLGKPKATASWEVSQHTKTPKDIFDVKALRLLDGDGKLLEKPALQGEQISVEMEIEVLEYDEDLTLGFSLNNSGGDILFWSYQTDHKSQKPLPAGHYKLSALIDTSLLNEDEYTITAIGGLHFKRWVLSPENSPATVEFALLRDSSQASSLNNVTRSTILAPLINWRIIK